MHSILVAFVFLAASLNSISGAYADKLQDILSRGVVRIGVPLDMPPYGYLDENRQPLGYDVEIAQMVAEDLGVKLEMQQIVTPNRIPFLMTDKVDIIIANLALSPERATQVMFTTPYANNILGIWGPKDIKVNVDSEDLNGLRVSVTKGNTSDYVASAEYPNADFMRNDNSATTFQAYLSKQADLIVSDTLLINELAKKNPNADLDMKTKLRDSPAQMAVQMDQHNLLRWLDSFIFVKKQTGDLDKLSIKYFGEPMGTLPTL